MTTSDVNLTRNDADRSRETELLYRAVFRREPPAVVVERFIPVSERVDASASTSEVRKYYRALDGCRDLEALEVAARYRGRLPLLTRKMQLLVYIAETEPGSQRYFVSEKRSRIGAVAAIALGGLGTAAKLVRGFYLLSRFDGD